MHGTESRQCVEGLDSPFAVCGTVSAASVDELRALVHSIDGIGDADLYGWLGGPLSRDSNPSAEYLAFTALGMAIDSAKLKLRRRD